MKRMYLTYVNKNRPGLQIIALAIFYYAICPASNLQAINRYLCGSKLANLRTVFSLFKAVDG